MDSREYVPLGRTGMEVSPFCLGTMMLGSVGNPDHGEGVRIVRTALESGINFIDTADMYSAGESEVIVGKALAGCRDDVILATKGHFGLEEGPNRSGNSRRYLTRAVEASLRRRLGTGWIDLYQVHRPDWDTDVEETLGVLTDLVRDGKIRAFGCSTFPAHEIVDAHRVSRARGLMSFRSEQPPYNLLARGIERDVLPVAERWGMGVLTWSPLAFGFLTGRYRKGAAAPAGARAALRPQWFDPADPVTARKLDVVEQLMDVAAAATLPALATAFPLAHRAVTSVIIGPRTPEQAVTSLKTMDLRLGDDILDCIDEIVPPGTEVYNPQDASLHLPWLTDAALRHAAFTKQHEDRRKIMSSTQTVAAGPLGGTPAGIWRIDPMHSSVSFSVRHLMSKVRGRFRDVDGRIGISPDLPDCSVSAVVAVTSVDTGTPQRDDDLRSDRFLGAAGHPEMAFESTAVEVGADGTGTVTGDLTIRDVTRQVRLEAEFLGLDATGLQGEPRIGFSARTTIRRSDFHVGERSAAGTKVVVGDAVAVELDVEAYLEEASPPQL